MDSFLKQKYSGADIVSAAASAGWVTEKLSEDQARILWEILLNANEIIEPEQKFEMFYSLINIAFIKLLEIESQFESNKILNKEGKTSFKDGKKISTTVNNEIKELSELAGKLANKIDNLSKYTKSIINDAWFESPIKTISKERDILTTVSHRTYDLADFLYNLDVEVGKGPESPSVELIIERLVNVYEIIIGELPKRNYDAYKEKDSGNFLDFVRKFFSFAPDKFVHLHEKNYTGAVRKVLDDINKTRG